MTIAPAMAVQLAPNFGLGAGARITLDGLGAFSTEVPTATGQYKVDTLTQSSITGQVSPTFGFYARSHEFLRFALTYQGSSYAYYHKTERDPIDPNLQSGYVNIEYAAKYNFIPRRLTLGIVGVPDEHITLDAEMAWVGWSEYYPPFPKTRIDFTPLAQAHLSYARPTIYQPTNPNFSDTVEIRLGVEPRVNKYLCFRVGYAYLPSPAPAQTGSTSILAMRSQAISIGAGANFAGPKSDLVNIDLAITDHIDSSETINKIPSQMQETTPGTNPGYPRLVASAQYIFSALNVTFHF
jgi:long-subunit fatty acid transport protein